MHHTLRILIDEFRSAQDVGVRVLTNDLKIPRPQSGRDWHDYCCMHGLFRLRLFDDVSFYAHGYGIELKIKSLTIDFDWGDNGQADGFDVWRLAFGVCTTSRGKICHRSPLRLPRSNRGLSRHLKTGN